MLTDLEEAECVVAVADLLKGRMQELATIYCARDRHANRKPSFSDQVGEMLDRMAELIGEYSIPAQRLIDQAEFDAPAKHPLRAVSPGDVA